MRENLPKQEPGQQPSHSSALVITISGAMRGKGRPRVTRRGTYTPGRTRAASSAVTAAAMAQVGAVRLSGPLGLAMDVAMAVPASWGRTKRLAALAGALRPVVKPDVDNMLKLVADALNGVIWIDDAQVVDARVTKRYAAEGSTVLTVWTITGEAP